MRYIRGGANRCTEFVQNSRSKIKPRRLLIHIGARDLHGDGVKEHEFKVLFSEATSAWPQSDVFFLPILKRKDISYTDIQITNQHIFSASNV